MGRDRTEARERGQTSGAKNSHPIMAIEKRVMDSEAYADLTFAARSVLDQLSKARTKDGNGHIFLPRRVWKELGISDRTVTRTLVELADHGFVFKTRTGGIGRGCSTYALTWLPIPKKEGLFLQGFKLCAWRDWKPKPQSEKKTRTPNLRKARRNSGGLPPSSTSNLACITDAIFTHYEWIPILPILLNRLRTELPDGKCPARLPAQTDDCLNCNLCQAESLAPTFLEAA